MELLTVFVCPLNLAASCNLPEENSGCDSCDLHTLLLVSVIGLEAS